MAGAAETRPWPPQRVFCDTSYFYACADTDDGFHQRALILAGEAVNRGTRLWTTWDVISETVTLLRYRHSTAAAIRFLDDVKPGLRVAEYARVSATKRNRSSAGMPAITGSPSVTPSPSSWSPPCSTTCRVSRSTRTSAAWA